MSLSGSLGKSASDLFAELFPTENVSLDLSQNSASDASPVPTVSSNPEPSETTAQGALPHTSPLLAHYESDGSVSDLDNGTADGVLDASSGHASASATLYQDPTPESDHAFYALSSDAYWSNDGGLSHRFDELGTNSQNGELGSSTNASDATFAADFDGVHVTFNDSTTTIFSSAPPYAQPSPGAAACSAPIDTMIAAAPIFSSPRGIDAVWLGGAIRLHEKWPIDIECV